MTSRPTLPTRRLDRLVKRADWLVARARAEQYSMGGRMQRRVSRGRRRARW
jgi:hypothetical protein